MIDVILADIWKNVATEMVKGDITKQAFLINRSKKELYDIPPTLTHIPSTEYAVFLAMAVDQVAADMVVMLLASWVTTYNPGVDDFIQPSLSPNRVEYIVMTYKTAEGTSGCHMAKINRTDGAASISEDVQILTQSFDRFLDGVFIKPHASH